MVVHKTIAIPLWPPPPSSSGAPPHIEETPAPTLTNHTTTTHIDMRHIQHDFT
jgi:hypothetical protein